MFSRWFKRSNRLEHEDPSERLQAIHDLSDEQARASQPILIAIATDDSDLEVRKAAIASITDPDALSGLLDQQSVATSVAKAIATLVAAGHPSNAATHPCVLEERINIATTETLEDLIELVTRPEQAAQLALRCPVDVRERVLAMPCLRTEAGLAVLEKHSRGRDKACNRFARQRIEAFKQARTALHTAQERLVELDASIAKELNHHPQDNAGLVVHRKKLSRLHDMRISCASEINTAVQDLGEISGVPASVPIAPDPLAGIDLSIPDPASDPFPTFVAALQQLSMDMRDATDLDQVSPAMDKLTTAWLASADTQPPSLQQHQVFENVSRQFQQLRSAWDRLERSVAQPAPPTLGPDWKNQPLRPLLDDRTRWLQSAERAIKKLAWPNDHALPPMVEQSSDVRARIAHEIQQIRDQHDSQIEKVATLTRELEASIDQGKLDAARNHLRSIRGLQKSGFAGEEHEINTLAARFDELKDWQSFATHPKRNDLIQAVTELVDQPLAPADQASRLKELRQAWNQLGRPNSPQEVSEQAAFDELAEKAFSTCKVYFEEQTKLRADNLVRRQALCKQLQTYLDETDWSQADMQAAETIMRHARQEWREYHPCERRALKPVEQQFEDLQSQLHAKVKNAWDNNVAQKRAIVEAAQALLESENVQDAINSAKSLQVQWREVGSTPRSIDQRLWREFRQTCDQLFNRRSEQNQAANEARKEHRQVLEARVAELESAAQSDSVSHKGLQTLMHAISEAASNLTLERQISDRVTTAEAQYKTRIEAQNREQKVIDLLAFRDWDIAVSEAEQTSHPIDAPHAVFARRLAGEGNAEDPLNLTLEAEIAADLPSPSADQSSRMALQIELMNRGVRNLDGVTNKQFIERWCGMDRKDSDAGQAAELRERFFAALRKRL